ncbi:MAG: Uma2 family endonuclease [Verrucomicrobia bacterium]|nr:Uma2 family endonuclease [Verrucomicrobiota bacterium]
MSQVYTEFIEGFPTERRVPGARHEEICSRLHAHVAAAIGQLTACKLLPPRTEITLDDGSKVCPDLTLVTAAVARVLLVAEVIQAGDHSNDTVVKKQLYEILRVPRLWMVDPRYDNVEVYHGTPHGLALRCILAGREQLTEELLPQLRCVIAELFGTK